MIKILLFLAKTFLTIFLTAVFARWLLSFFHVSVVVVGGEQVGLIAIISFVCFIIGLSAGLIWGEESARKSFRNRADLY